MAFTGQPSAVVAGVSIAPAVQITARTSLGALATNFNGPITIGFAANPGGSVITGTVTVNAVNGVAAFTDLSMAVAGAGYALSATAAGLSGATSNVFTVTPAAASAVLWSQQPVGGTAGVALVPAPRVRVVDAFGNTAPFAGNATIALAANPGGASLAGTLTVALASSEATFSDVRLSAIGVGYTLQAVIAGLPTVTSNAFVVGAGSVTWISASGGAWSNASNWLPARVPVAGDSVVITLSGTYTVTVDVPSPNVARAILGGASGVQTLAMTSRTLTVAGSMIVGANGAVSASSSTINGPGVLTNNGTLSLVNSTINAPFVNQGLVVANATNAITGAFTASAGSVLRLQGDNTTGFASLTVATGFTNAGAIKMTSFLNASSATLSVTSGSLTNAPGGTITALVGAGGARTLAAQLDNQGTVTVLQPLVVNRAGANHVNSGTIDLTAENLTVTQSGTSPSFTNTGTITIGTGRTWTITNGVLNQSAGTLGGPGTLNLSAVAANFTTNFSTATTTLVLTGTTLNGPGTLTNAAGQTLPLINSTIAAPFVNQGLVVANATNAITGAFTAAAGSVVRLQGDNTTGFSSLTVATGFTNAGAIEMTSFLNASSVTLAVTSGSLTNAPGGTITALVGGGGARTLAAQLNNQGTLTVGPGTAGLLTINGSLTTSGTINLELGGLTTPTQYDQIAVTGSATLGGTLNVALINAFTPASGNTFQVLTTTGTRSGTFATTNLPPSITAPPTYVGNGVNLIAP